MTSQLNREGSNIKIDDMDDHASSTRPEIETFSIDDRFKFLYWMLKVSGTEDSEHYSDWLHSRVNTWYSKAKEDKNSIEKMPTSKWDYLKITDKAGKLMPYIPAPDEIVIPKEESGSGSGKSESTGSSDNVSTGDSGTGGDSTRNDRNVSASNDRRGTGGNSGASSGRSGTGGDGNNVSDSGNGNNYNGRGNSGASSAGSGSSTSNGSSASSGSNSTSPPSSPPGAQPIRSVKAPDPVQVTSDGNGEAAPLMTSLAAKRNLPGPGKPEAFHPNLWGRRCIMRYGRREFPLHLVERSPYTVKEAEELGLETFGDGHTLGEKAKGKIRVYQSPDFAGIYSVAWPTRLDRELDDDLEKLRPEKGKYVGLCWLRVGWKLKNDEGQYILDSNGEHVIKKCWESRSVLTAMWGPGTAALAYDLATSSYERYCRDQGRDWTPGRSVSPALLRGPSVVPDTGSGGNGPTSRNSGLFLRSSPVPGQNENEMRSSTSRSPPAIPIPQSAQPAAQAEAQSSLADILSFLSTPQGKAQIAAALASGQHPSGQGVPGLPQQLPQQVGAY